MSSKKHHRIAIFCVVSAIGGSAFAQQSTETADLIFKKLTVPTPTRYQVAPPPEIDRVKRAITSATITARTTETLAAVNKPTTAPLANFEIETYPKEGKVILPPWKSLAGFRLQEDPLPDTNTEPNLPIVSAIPDGLYRLNNQEAKITGFMLPLEFDAKLGVLSFMLMRDRALCCFGRAPRVNEFVVVQMPKGKGARFLNDVPMWAQGTVQVSEVRDGGLLVGIYRMIATDVQPLVPMR